MSLCNVASHLLFIWTSIQLCDVLTFRVQLIAEMVMPVVNKEALAELESMGLRAASVTRALHYTGDPLFPLYANFDQFLFLAWGYFYVRIQGAAV